MAILPLTSANGAHPSTSAPSQGNDDRTANGPETTYVSIYADPFHDTTLESLDDEAGTLKSALASARYVCTLNWSLVPDLFLQGNQACSLPHLRPFARPYRWHRVKRCLINLKCRSQHFRRLIHAPRTTHGAKKVIADYMYKQ